MAANLKSTVGLANLGKRFVGQIRSLDHSFTIPSLSSSFRRGVHNSVYEKNPEEHVQPNIVPDHVIPPQTGEYWAPHPQTGVFGPPADGSPASGGSRGMHASGTTESVLEEKAFFRPLEDLDLEKPVHI